MHYDIVDSWPLQNDRASSSDVEGIQNDRAYEKKNPSLQSMDDSVGDRQKMIHGYVKKQTKCIVILLCICFETMDPDPLDLYFTDRLEGRVSMTYKMEPQQLRGTAGENLHFLTTY